MPTFKNLALGMLAVAAAVSASDVTQLKASSYDDFIKENDIVLAKFYAPWCGHCQALKPEYDKAATALKEKNIKLVKVDCMEEQELCRRYDVDGYPTLKVFRGQDNVSPYKGQRKAAGIISYMVKQSLPAVSIITADTLEDFKKADKVVVMAYLESSDKASNETLTEMVERLRDQYPFGACHDASLAEAEGAKMPGLVLYKDFDEGKATYTSTFDIEAMEKWLKMASTPLIGEVGPETYAGYMSAGIPLAYIFAETADERAKLSETFKPLAEVHRRKINFATIDASAYGAHAGNLNLRADKFPAFVIHEVNADSPINRKFPFDQDKELTLETLTTFVDDFAAGELVPSIKSEPVPEKQDGPVTVVVAKNYADIVLDDDKDVLIKFYAPWCGHCQALAPKYDKLGALYSKGDLKDKITIAKVDATVNDVPDGIDGFPTIKLYPAGGKSDPITYSGSRTVEDLIKFIVTKGKHKASPLQTSEEAASPMATATDSGGDKEDEAAATAETPKAADEPAAATAGEKGGEPAEKAEEKKTDVHDEL